MRNALSKTIAASGIAAAAIVGLSTPAFAQPTPPVATVGGPMAPSAGGAPQQFGVQPGPGGGAAQGLSVRPDSKECHPAPASSRVACSVRESSTSQNAQNLWNFGGAQLGGGAANLISSAFFGIPSFALDLIHGILNIFH